MVKGRTREKKAHVPQPTARTTEVRPYQERKHRGGTYRDGDAVANQEGLPRPDKVVLRDLWMQQEQGMALKRRTRGPQADGYQAGQVQGGERSPPKATFKFNFRCA